MRDLIAQALVLLVQAPGQRRQPSEAALHQRDFQFGDFFKYALDHQGGHQRFLGLRVGRVFFVVEGRPAAPGGRMAGRAAQMQRDGESVGGARL